MKVRVRFFAMLREKTGASELAIELSSGDQIPVAIEQLALRYPSINPYLSKVAFAVNEQYMPIDTELHDGDELALIPPVSGG